MLRNVDNNTRIIVEAKWKQKMKIKLLGNLVLLRSKKNKSASEVIQNICKLCKDWNWILWLQAVERFLDANILGSLFLGDDELSN